MATHLNVEIKARSGEPAAVLLQLAALGAKHQGEDRQVDTYFRVPAGRLKLRQGNIENSLIHYARSGRAGTKDSHVTLYETREAARLSDVLHAALEVLVVVDKRRQILWIDNVKFHVDDVTGLGSFVEIEAIDRVGGLGRDMLLSQCQNYMRMLHIPDGDLEARSYSDLLEQPVTARRAAPLHPRGGSSEVRRRPEHLPTLMGRGRGAGPSPTVAGVRAARVLRDVSAAAGVVAAVWLGYVLFAYGLWQAGLCLLAAGLLLAAFAVRARRAGRGA